jgi:hypothetical protein
MTEVRTPTPTYDHPRTTPPVRTGRATFDAWLGIGVKVWAIIALILASVIMSAVIYFSGAVLANLSKTGSEVNQPTVSTSVDYCAVDPTADKCPRPGES